jgi:hypothetical protein
VVAQGTLAATNYTFVFVNGTLAITPAVLTVTANSFTVAQGASIPTLTYAITGFLNGDTQATATTGMPSLSTTATSTSPPGNYPITVTPGTLAAANYTFVFVNGTLTITTSSTSVGSFTISATPSYQEVKGGSSAAFDLTLTSVNGFAGTVTLSCSGQPQDGACSFSTSPSIVLTANGTGDSAIDITTTAADAQLRLPGDRGETMPPGFAAMVLPFNFSGLATLLAGVLKRRQSAKRSRMLLILCLLALALMVVGLTGCGCPPTGHQTYLITVTGTSGSESASTTVTLVVGQRQL